MLGVHLKNSMNVLSLFFKAYIHLNYRYYRKVILAVFGSLNKILFLYS